MISKTDFEALLQIQTSNRSGASPHVRALDSNRLGASLHVVEHTDEVTNDMNDVQLEFHGAAGTSECKQQ